MPTKKKTTKKPAKKTGRARGRKASPLSVRVNSLLQPRPNAVLTKLALSGRFTSASAVMNAALLLLDLVLDAEDQGASVDLVYEDGATEHLRILVP